MTVARIRGRGAFAPAALFALAATFLVAAPAQGIVLHDDNQPALHPDDGVIGRWIKDGSSPNASCVVVGRAGWTGSNYVLTTTHQGGGGSSTVSILGHDYAVDAMVYEPDDDDIRIVRLAEAYLPAYATLHTGTQEWTLDEIVLGGHGMVRGDPVPGKDGYYWGGAPNNTNGLHWGTNTISGTGNQGTLVKGYFNGPESPNTTPYEAIGAKADSGGGWLYNAGTAEEPEWEVVGLIRGVEHAEEWQALYGDGYDGDWMDAVRISTYASQSWLDDFLIEPSVVMGDANFDDLVNQDDLSLLLAHFGIAENAIWRQGDFDLDGDVDDADLSLLLGNFDTDPPEVHLPEPASAGLLALGAAALLRRRRRR